MPEQVLHRFQSRRNEVYLAQTDAGRVVQKYYPQKENCSRELEVYQMLRERAVPHARVISFGQQKIVLTCLAGSNLVDVLDEQERSGIICRNVWKKLVSWLADFHAETGLTMSDVNLRNFLYDREADILYGVDFEECEAGDLTQTIAQLAAYIRNYAPEHTPVKRKIAEYILQEFSCCYGVPMEELLPEAERQEKNLLDRRKRKNYGISEN